MCHIQKGAPKSVITSPTPALKRAACWIVTVDGVVDDEDPAQPCVVGCHGEQFAQTLQRGQVVYGADHAVVRVAQVPDGSFGDRVRFGQQSSEVAPCRAGHREDERVGEEHPPKKEGAAVIRVGLEEAREVVGGQEPVEEGTWVWNGVGVDRAQRHRLEVPPPLVGAGRRWHRWRSRAERARIRWARAGRGSVPPRGRPR